MSFTLDTLGNNFIDTRDIIDYFESLDTDDEEYEIVESLLDDLKGYGGDHQWRGDWYPVSLIHEDHFKDYAREFAEDCGMVDPDVAWPNSFIDWDAAADALKNDYSTVDIKDEQGFDYTYYYR